LWTHTQLRQQSNEYDRVRELEARLAVVRRVLDPSFSLDTARAALFSRMHHEIDRYFDAFLPFIDRLPGPPDVAYLIEHLKAIMVLPAVLVESRIATYLAIHAHFAGGPD